MRKISTTIAVLLLTLTAAQAQSFQTTTNGLSLTPTTANLGIGADAQSNVKLYLYNSQSSIYNLIGLYSHINNTSTTAHVTYGILDVNGTIRAREVRVNLNWGADFVFEKDYKLMPINELSSFISENKHLPDIAPATEMTAADTDLGEMQIKLLQKVEELTLYIIQQNQKIESLENKVKDLENK